MLLRKLTRRQLLLGLGGAGTVALGSGLFLGIYKARQRRWAKPVDRGGDFAPSVYLAISSDDQVSVWVTKTEMGQGVLTALPLIVAEELDADFEKVEVQMAVLDDQYDYGSMFTAASGSVASLWTELRRTGAAARAMLLEAAAERFALSEDECEVRAGKIKNKKTGEVLSFGELAEAASGRSAPLFPRLKEPSEFRLIGTSPPRKDIPAKVRGEAKYGIDVRVDGALWVAVRRGPSPDAKLVHVDDSTAKQLPGVLEIKRIGDLVAVVGDCSWTAMRGAEALQARWDAKAAIDTDELRRRLVRAVESPGLLVFEEGTDTKPAAKALDATYSVPLLAHAPMEPLNSTVSIHDDRCDIWVPTQNPEGVRAAAARILGWAPHQITVHRSHVGGGFGRRTHSDETEEAIQVARALNRPVHLTWTREEDIRHDFYREQVVHRLMGDLAGEGNQLRLVHRIASSSNQLSPETSASSDDMVTMGADHLPYNMATLRVDWQGVKSPVRLGIWRSVGYSHNTFAHESFIDELAEKKGLDPLDLRLRLLPSDSPLLGCLKKVQQTSSYEKKKKAAALGVAVCSCFGSHIAMIMQVEPSKDDFSVTNVWCAVSCGTIIDPNNVRAQIEGGIIFGLSAALYGKIEVREGEVVQSNFHDFKILRHAQAPRMMVDLLPSAAPPSGVGELGVPTVAPALCNALFRLKKERHRSLPLLS